MFLIKEEKEEDDDDDDDEDEGILGESNSGALRDLIDLNKPNKVEGAVGISLHALL